MFKEIMANFYEKANLHCKNFFRIAEAISGLIRSHQVYPQVWPTPNIKSIFKSGITLNETQTYTADILGKTLVNVFIICILSKLII